MKTITFSKVSGKVEEKKWVGRVIALAISLVFILAIAAIIGEFGKQAQNEDSTKLNVDVWGEQKTSALTFNVHNKGSDLHDVILNVKAVYWDDYFSRFDSYSMSKEYGDIPHGVTAIIALSPADCAAQASSYSWNDFEGFPFNEFVVTIQCEEGQYETTLS